MHEEATTVPRRLHRRIGLGMLKRGNWLQLLRFAFVGGSGYVINIAVYATAVHVAKLPYTVAAAIAFMVAVVNNFWWNRHWTFDAGHGHAGFQAARFFTVSVAAFGLNLLLLVILVSALDVARVPAQAIAVLCAMPVSFVGNKLWTFHI
jgi:dolichol-phosphate mannosyltransferase